MIRLEGVGMEIVEMIHLRLAGRDADSLGHVIREVVGRVSDPRSVRIYHNAWLDSDLAVHLHRNVENGSACFSEVGDRLTSVLRDYGMVEHTLWLEHFETDAVTEL